MANGKCRFHGGKSTGPRTAAGLQRSRDARLIHGLRSAEIIELRATAARVGRTLQALTAIAKDRFATKPQSTRSAQSPDRAIAAFSAGHGVHRSNSRSLSAPAFVGAGLKPAPTASMPGGVKTITEDTMQPGKDGRHGFVPFVTSWCEPSSRAAGQGVDRPDFSHRRRAVA
jgi:hypothetical protein